MRAQVQLPQPWCIGVRMPHAKYVRKGAPPPLITNKSSTYVYYHAVIHTIFFIMKVNIVDYRREFETQAEASVCNYEVRGFSTEQSGIPVIAVSAACTIGQIETMECNSAAAFTLSKRTMQNHDVLINPVCSSKTF